MQVECVRGYCATNNVCSNQNFQNGGSALLLLQHSRNKGVSLVADQAITRGDFIVQYAGEVISIDEYKLREEVSIASSVFDRWTLADVFVNRRLLELDTIMESQ
jgi:SET domain-containing protein